MRVLETLEPKSVFGFFEDISMIPRGSHNEKAVSDFILEFAETRGLFVVQDELCNLVIKKPGSIGYENAKPIIIQGHLDMVCEKNKDSIHDFLVHPLELIIENGYIRANNTTLGGDDGIAVAYAMALLDADDIPHPPLEIVLTVNEESGMEGAAYLSKDLLTAKTVINIDSEDEGVYLSSCAGGLKVKCEIPVYRMDIPAGYISYMISVGGLIGGHSGIDIDKERGNANKIMGRLLHQLSKQFDFYLSELHGGMKDNAIPRESDAVIFVDKNRETELFRFITSFAKLMKNEYLASDSGIVLKIEPCLCEIKPFTKETTDKVLASINIMPDGISTMSKHIDGLVETSCNLGVVESFCEYIRYIVSIRSSVSARKYYLYEKIKSLIGLVGGEAKITSDYPAWEYKSRSEIRDVFIETYEELFHKKAKIEAIHAGLECGLLAEKIDAADIISFGPDMCDIHTPTEKISIESIANTWKLLLAVLKKLK